MQKAVSLQKTYKGVLHKDSLRWCRGSIGLEHDKIRKFRYPFYKYIQVYEYCVIVCVCKNCSMVFFGQEAAGVPLSIPVYKHPTGYFYLRIAVSVNGRVLPMPELPLRRTNLGWVTQEMINEDTRNFIEKVQ